MRLALGRSFHEAIAEYHRARFAGISADSQTLFHRLISALAAVCDAMAYAHSQGVVHGDLTPANVFVSDSGEAAILDWEFARRIRLNIGTSLPSSQVGEGAKIGDRSSDDEKSPPIAGTPSYMAPEQVAGIADARTDVFGVGSIMYEMIAGCAPYAWEEGARPSDWHQQVRDARFPRPRRRCSAAPRGLEVICLKAMACRAEQRFGSMPEIATAIRDYQSTVDRPRVRRFWQVVWEGRRRRG
jgi:serine/threonine protein kinase